MNIDAAYLVAVRITLFILTENSFKEFGFDEQYGVFDNFDGNVQ